MPRPSSIICALLLIPLPAPAQPFDNSVLWDMASAPTGQKNVYNWKANGGSYGMPLLVGDWNGDGRGDLATTAMRVSSAGRSEAGEIYVYFGDGNISGIINGASPAPGTQLIIQGPQSFAHLGSYLQTADFNGDGIEDLLLGAQNGDGPGGRNNCGSAWIIFGSTSLVAGTIDLAAPPAGVTGIFGRDVNDRLGIWVDRGDLNGDNIADALLAADQGDGPTNGTLNCGEVWVLFGQTTWPATIDLQAPPPNATVVYGIDSGDHMGASVYGADLDNDGKDELLLGAGLNRLSAGLMGQATGGGNGPGESRPDCGEIYVVWGAASFPAAIDLRSAPPADLTTIYGENGGDCFGEEIDAGDLDGDGNQDLLGGALTAGPFGRSFGGAVYVIYGGPSLRGQFIDLRTAPGVAKVYGAASSDINGDTLTACDLNRDGLDDLVNASPGSSPLSRFGAGNVDVFYGSKVRLSGVIDLLTVPDTVPRRFLVGVDPGDTAAYSMASGNADNDLFVDLFINAMTGDGFQNGSNDAGDGYCVSGRVLSRGSTGVTSLPRIGTTLTLAIRVEPNAVYLAACSLSRAPGLQLPGGGTIHLAPDALFALSVSPGGAGVFNNFNSVADGLGRGQPDIAIPGVATLVGVKVYFGYVGITGSTITTISQSLGIVLLP